MLRPKHLYRFRMFGAKDAEKNEYSSCHAQRWPYPPTSSQQRLRRMDDPPPPFPPTPPPFSAERIWCREWKESHSGCLGRRRSKATWQERSTLRVEKLIANCGKGMDATLTPRLSFLVHAGHESALGYQGCFEESEQLVHVQVRDPTEQVRETLEDSSGGEYGEMPSRQFDCEAHHTQTQLGTARGLAKTGKRDGRVLQGKGTV
ncbi:hypothetical protein K438DRAFT_2160944 [Mycena galopus ATCC 62051]|nr:hypothetical protein K438DRAFT_2160944 [Mycena galopus ATCC 62051]